MIKVTVELYPGGSEKGKRELCTVALINTGTRPGAMNVYSYHVVFADRRFGIRETDVGHMRQDHVLELLLTSLVKLSDERKIPDTWEPT